MRLSFVLLLVACSPGVTTPDGGGTGGGSAGGSGGGSAGGSGGSGGSGGGSSSSTDGGFYGAPRCPPSVIVCDDFEAASIDTATWNIHLDSGGTLTPDTTRAARGTRSLHAQTPTSGGDAMVELKMKVPLDGQRLWGRMFLYLPAHVQPELQDHTNLATAAGNNDLPTNSVYAAWVGGGKLGSLFYQDTPNIDTSGLGLNTLAPVDRWFCLEWDFNGVDKQIRVFFDGALIPMSVLDGYHPPISATLRNGVQFNLSEAWFDSVAWSRTRIGCAD